MDIKTIETSVRVQGKEKVLLSTVSAQDEPLKKLVADHMRYVENWVAAQENRHPLEEVFAGLGEFFGDAEVRAQDGGNYKNIDIPFSRCIDVTRRKGEPSYWVRTSTDWVAVRLIKMGRYKTLSEVLEAAIEQATKGKGQRHGGDKTPFLEQPWVRLYKTHGLGFLLGQADKKYHEACGKENKEDAEREFLGAIVYLGMSLLVLEGKVK